MLVIPSLWYDFPLVAYEALATGTIIIATDLPGLNETIEPNVNGLLFPRGDVVALAQQLTRLVEDPDLFDRLRRQTTKVKTIAEATRELESLYQLLCNAS